MLRKPVVWLLVLCVFFGMTGARAATGFSGDPVAVESAAQSVLMLEVYNHGELIATGSGFVAFAENALVTNRHVIDGADSILAKSDRGTLYVLDKIYAVDAKKDVAILGFSTPAGLSPLALDADGGVMRVEPVVAIGSPKRLLNTVSVGNVSAVFRQEDTRYIQFTAPISSGSSGGALFNNDGEVIGITTSVFEESAESVQNLNFAIHISEAADLWKKVDEGSWIPVANYPAFQKTAADFPEASQAAHDSDGVYASPALALTMAFFSPYVALWSVLTHRTAPPAPADWIAPLQSLADGALKRDKAHAFDIQWEGFEAGQADYNYYTVTVREGSTPYTLFAGISEDGISSIVFVMDIDGSLWEDDAYAAIVSDLGEAFIRASGADGAALADELRGFRRTLDGYRAGDDLDEAYELYGDIGYFTAQHAPSDGVYPDSITLAFSIYAPPAGAASVPGMSSPGLWTPDY